MPRAERHRSAEAPLGSRGLHRAPTLKQRLDVQHFRDVPLDDGRALHPRARRGAAHVAVPPPVGATLERACGDCHSHGTRWPWYSRVAPASWLVVEHVDHGRRHLNFSDWQGGGGERARDPLGAICREVSDGRMPLPSYLLLHPQAQLSPGDVEALCSWARASAARASREEG